MKKARIIYNHLDDRFEIYIMHEDGEWELYKRFICQHSTTESPNTVEADYISWEILKEIRDMCEIGYEIYLMGTWIKER